jgi:cephalosporin hydroxylase
MKYTVDTEARTLLTEEGEFSLYSPEAFEILSETWLKVGWNGRYHYTFTWLGRPVLQLPEDLIRLQEVIWELKPDVIIETGIAMGGSLLFYATLCQALGNGRVVGVDIDLKPHNREKLLHHPLSPYITFINGDSAHPDTISQIQIAPDETVLVILDSNHSKRHVLKELELYSQLVTPGSYLIVADGFKKHLVDVPRGKEQWSWDNPSAAVKEFLASHPEYALKVPERRYNRSLTRKNVTHFQDGWLMRL